MKMESNYELKEIDIKNCMCYYFDDIMRVRDFDFNILLEEKSCEDWYEKILIYDSSFKTFVSANPLHFRFNKVDGFIKFMTELGIYYYLVLKDLQFMSFQHFTSKELRHI